MRIKKVSVTLDGLTANTDMQAELFDVLPTEGLKQRQRGERISQAMDKINHKYGRDSILLGMMPSQGKSFSGSKIAFTRIPDREEFLE
jgi:DNA polymerase-4